MNTKDDLVLEFKNAANSVTRLFKLARDATINEEEAKKLGYQAALHDLLALLSTNSDFDIQGWAMHTLLEMNDNSNKKEKCSRKDEDEQLLLMSGNEETEDNTNYDSGDKRRSAFSGEVYNDKRMKY